MREGKGKVTVEVKVEVNVKKGELSSSTSIDSE